MKKLMTKEPTKESLFSDEDFNLWMLLNLTKDAISRAREREVSRYGISAREAGALLITRAIGERATPAEIARWLFRQPHSVSGLLNRMEKDGLIRKAKDLERKNLVRVVITEKGARSFSLSTKRSSIRRIMSALTPEERQQLTTLLTKLRAKALRELGITHKLPFR